MAMTVLGDKTKTRVYKHESHKLHQAFPVAMEAGVPKVINQGDLVKLNADGTIERFSGDSAGYIGVAITDSKTPAYGASMQSPIRVTALITVGNAICKYIAAAEIAETGAVYVSGYTGDSSDVPVVTTSEAGNTGLLALATAAAGEVVPVLVG